MNRGRFQSRFLGDSCKNFGVQLIHCRALRAGYMKKEPASSGLTGSCCIHPPEPSSFTKRTCVSRPHKRSRHTAEGDLWQWLPVQAQKERRIIYPALFVAFFVLWVSWADLLCRATPTGLEPATSGSTVRKSSLRRMALSFENRNSHPFQLRESLSIVWSQTGQPESAALEVASVESGSLLVCHQVEPFAVCGRVLS